MSTTTAASMQGVTAPGQFSAGIEALGWWFKGSPVPPLVSDGIVGRPQTRVLLGGSELDTGTNPGFRISGAYGLASHSGVEGNVFYLPSRSTGASVDSSGHLGSTNLIIPYIDAATGTESGTEISFAPVYQGSARLTLRNSLLGAELNGVWALAPAAPWRMDVLGGFRYLRLRETLTLTTDSINIPPFPQDIWNTSDEFDATSNFYGAQAGIRARFEQDRFFGSASAKLALGAMMQSVNVNGSLVTNDYTNFGPTQTFAGGYFALPTNIGNHSRTTFAVVPEVALNVGYHITPAAAIYVGYSFMYVSNVVRPGNQINRTINPTQSTSYTENPAARLTGPAQPAFQFNDSGFWAQGMTLGLSVRF